MARQPLAPTAQQALFVESLKPGGGTRVFKSASEFAAGAPKKKRYKRRDFSATADSFVLDVGQMIATIQSGQDPATVWAPIDNRHIVALYAVMHRDVYGELPGELAGDWMAACSAAQKLLREEFDSQPLSAVEYLRWAFAREKKREQRRTGDGSGWRLGWRYALMKRELLTDFRIASKRNGMKRA